MSCCFYLMMFEWLKELAVQYSTTQILIMNMIKISFYAVGLYLMLVISSTVITLVFGTEEAVNSHLIMRAQYILDFVLSMIMYTWLVFKKTSKPYSYAIYVAALFWAINIVVAMALNILVDMSFNPIIFLLPFLLHIVAVLIGVALGNTWRSKFTRDT